MTTTIRFETGPVRPPSEAESILLRITRGCHWNKCAFCPVYKHEQYSIRGVDEIKQDIDAMAAVAERFARLRACRAGAKRAKTVDAIVGFDHADAVDADCARLMAFWMFHGLRSVFLQDADALVLRTEKLVEILNHLRAAFPTITRITSYSRAKTVSRKSADELKALRAAGLSRIHVGMESGSDVVLSLMHKGVTQEEQIRSAARWWRRGSSFRSTSCPAWAGGSCRGSIASSRRRCSVRSTRRSCASAPRCRCRALRCIA